MLSIMKTVFLDVLPIEDAVEGIAGNLFEDYLQP